MTDLLQQITSPETINKAWKQLNGDKAMWLPGISRAEMERNLPLHLITLADEIRTGKYCPGTIRLFPLKNAKGKQRTISALFLRDKLAQKAVQCVLTPQMEKHFHQDSYGYRPGRSVDMAVRKTQEFIKCGMNWALDADITKFFDSIPHRQLKKTVKKYVTHGHVQSLIFDWIKTGTPRTGIFQQRRGIPQGSIISPLLCNIFLTPFDNSLSARNLPFVRFADDFVIFTISEKETIKARKYVDKLLQKMGLELHPQKTRIVPPDKQFIFLGKKIR
ncbi:reverse transcriptase domain-containing protein [Maridesulfovibrio zosterae]|uniref:reverse transcriptase domain-containing protein n=1 Tax=Maridesulfovibrio zosterae TaxID=82171 RepID=UPI0004101B74|nr:reverse transcriptase domain-containing protein [Maridesulfovibrio zosterae]